MSTIYNYQEMDQASGQQKSPFKDRRVVAIVLLVLGILAIYVFRFFMQRFGPAPTPALDWREVTPGRTTTEEVVEKLGEPMSETQAGAEKILSYQSEYPLFPHEVVAENDVVIFVKEWIPPNDGRLLSYYTNQFGEPSFFVYSNDSSDAFQLYVFPEEGLAVNAHVVDANVFHVWYFVPTTQEGFLQTFADYISTEPEGPEFILEGHDGSAPPEE